ncbi:MAG: hypothetical protein RIB47_08575 [Cyclobacteriaceae bacterium]
MRTTKKLGFSLIVALMVFFSACNEDGGIDLTVDDSASVENEATTDSYFEETDDLALIAVASDDATKTGGKVGTGGRKIGINDFRLACDGVEVTIEVADDSTPESPKGTITIDFGDGCEDARGNVRKGIIIINYEGRRFLPGSVIVTTFEGYEINGVKIEGKRTVTNVSGSLEEFPKFNIVVENGKATWPDGTFATREANRTREWIRAVNPLNDEWSVTGTAAGTNRNGTVYTMEVKEALVYKRECAVLNRIFMAVKGVKVLQVGDRVITIDYGDGECDRIVKVTINGESREVEVSGK